MSRSKNYMNYAISHKNTSANIYIFLNYYYVTLIYARDLIKNISSVLMNVI